MPIVERREHTRRPAQAPANRFALVIGCDAYPGNRLSKAVNDARDMHTLLKSAGFQSTLITDATKDEMILQQHCLVEAVTQYRGGDLVVCVYFSGHGEDMEGTKSTRLLAVDGVQRELGGLVVDSLVADLNRVASNMTLILLADACRSDESNLTFKTRAAAQGGTLTEQDWKEAMGRNAQMPTFRTARETRIHQNNKFFMGFACMPGTCALEARAERNGYFTKALLKHLRKPNQWLANAFMEVAEDVQIMSGHRQGPWSEGTTAGKFVFFPTENAGPSQQLQVLSPSSQSPSASDGIVAEIILTNTQQGLQQGSVGRARVAELLQRGANINLKRKDGECETALHVCARLGHVNSALFLLENGADINSTDKNGLTPLMWSIGHRQKDVLNVLLANGANVNATGKAGETALHLAAAGSSVDMSRRLLVCGADHTMKDHNGMTALDVAVKKGDRSAVVALLQNPPAPDANARNANKGDCCIM